MFCRRAGLLKQHGAQVFDFSFEALDLEDRAVLKDLMFEEVCGGRALAVA